MRQPIDNSQKTVFRNARIRAYDKPRMLAGCSVKQNRSSNKAAILVIKRKYKVKEIPIQELFA